jgi:hypothetical protein
VLRTLCHTMGYTPLRASCVMASCVLAWSHAHPMAHTHPSRIRRRPRAPGAYDRCADGTVNACSVLSGLLFYREYRYMSGFQLPLSLLGLVVVMAGVGVSIRPSRRSGSARGSTRVSMTSPTPTTPTAAEADLAA